MSQSTRAGTGAKLVFAPCLKLRLLDHTSLRKRQGLTGHRGDARGRKRFHSPEISPTPNV